MNVSRFARKSISAAAISACFIAAPVKPVVSAEITVSVFGAETDTGEIGCALFSGPDGFPLDTSEAEELWRSVQGGGSECRFGQLLPGTYAVAVSHDLNKNRATDTNFFGIPKEAWGVSNNVRPKLRAPRFEEASFELNENESAKIKVEVAK